MNETDVHVKGSSKTKRIHSVPFLSAEDFPEWMPTFTCEFNHLLWRRNTSCEHGLEY